MVFKHKKLLTAGLSAIMLISQAAPVLAVTDEDIQAAQNEKWATEQELAGVESDIAYTESLKQEVLDKIEGYDKELIITITAIKSLDKQIATKTAELVHTGEELEKAIENQNEQYDAMKKRIQYLYEQGGEAGWGSLIIGDANLSETVDTVDYTQSLYDYDRSELDSYTETVEKVETLQTQQTAQKAQLETMKKEQVSAKQNLEDLKSAAQKESEDYEGKIEEAEALAAEYYALIEQQNAQIAELQAQKAAEEEAARKAAEEAARKAAEEEAARQAAAEEAARQAAAAAAAQEAAYSGYGDNTYTDEQNAQRAATQAAIASGASTVDTSGGAGYGSATAVSSGGFTGQDVANYALQFVGYPYVWGGTSLTGGCDCSGFVMSVYAHFGIYLSRTTYTQANEGIGVSYGEMEPGDVAFTPAFDLKAKYIIHTIGPVWGGGDHREREIVADCYRKSLELAEELGCESIAFPLMATGNYGFPKDEALRIALSTISTFLLSHEMEVILVVYDKESFEVSGKLFSDIKAYIEEEDAVYKPRGRRRIRKDLTSKSDTEVLYHENDFGDTSELLPDAEDFHHAEGVQSDWEPVQSEDAVYFDADIIGDAFIPEVGSAIDERIRHLDKTFQEHLFTIIDRKGLKDPEVYKKANIDRKHFSKIRSNVDYKPSKMTAVALAIALELNLDQTRDLLMRAGLALSSSNIFDLIIEYCIENKVYDIYEINCILFEYDQPLLGA